MRGGQLHATLVFIGNVEQSRLEALQLAAQEVSGEGFEMRFDEARYWGHNHIVYAAPSHLPKPLAQLVHALELSLTRRCFKFESPHPNLPPAGKGTTAPSPLRSIRGLGNGQVERGDIHSLREYKPHVTLLRNAHWSDTPLPAMPPVCWQVKDFALVQSVHQDGLAGYRVLARFPFGACDG